MILYYISIFVLLSHSIRDCGLFRGLVFIDLSVFFYQHAQRPCHVAIVACFYCLTVQLMPDKKAQ